MKGGCFGKILSFVFGMVMGVVLLVGTIAGAGYYLVTKVTVGDIEQLAKQQLIPNQEATVRTKTLLDIFNMVKDGSIKNITVEEVYTVFGFDLIEILENTLDIKIEEGVEKENLKALPVLQVFQGSNLSIVLNSITLENVLTKMGVIESFSSMPLFAEHFSEPAVNALNAVMAELDLSNLQLGELEYLLGANFGTGLLDNFKTYTIGGLNTAINELTFENILPDFDRDYYFKVSENDQRCVADGYAELGLTPAYELISDYEAASGTTYEGTRYTLDTTDYRVAVDADAGTYKLIEEVYIKELYSKTTEEGVDTYKADRKGFYKTVIPEGIFASDRYSKDAADVYVQDNFGRYAINYVIPLPAEILGDEQWYQMSYVDKFVEESGVWVLEARGYKPVDITYEHVWDPVLSRFNVYDDETAAYVPALRYNVSSSGGTPVVNELVENDAGEYVAVHIGVSQQILKAMADTNLTGIDAKIGTLTVGDVMEIDESSSKLMQSIKDTKITELATKIDSLYLSDIIDIQTDNVVVETNTPVAGTSYVALPSTATSPMTAIYEGSYITGVIKNSEPSVTVKLVKYIDGITNVGSYFAGQKTYNIDTPASNGILAALGGLTVLELQSGVETVINNATLGAVLEIDGDVFVETTYANFAAVDAVAHDSIHDYYVFVDAEEDIFRNVSTDDTDTTSSKIYRKIYSGSSNAVIKKVALAKINLMAERIDIAINQTRLGEVLEPVTEYVLEVATDGDYVQLPAITGEYYGTYLTGTVTGTDTVYAVKWQAGMTGTRYSVVTSMSNGVLVKMADIKIGELAGYGMQNAMNATRIDEVMEITGDVYTKFAAAVNTYEAAYALLGGGDATVFYRDESGLFLSAGYIRTEETVDAYIYDASLNGGVGGYRLYVDGTDDPDVQRYSKKHGSVTEFYQKVYTGTSNAIIRKLATTTVQGLADSVTVNKAVDDSTLVELGAAPATDDGSLLYKIGGYRVCEMSYAIEDVMSAATLRELNAWGELGLTDTTLDALKAANGGNDMTAKYFFENMQLYHYVGTEGEELGKVYVVIGYRYEVTAP